MSDRVIINGDPGTTWTNDTARARYQFICLMINTCGFCLQYHLKISASWPIPMHFGCHCKQVAIKPGQSAPEPFCNYRELLDHLKPRLNPRTGKLENQQSAAIGASNYKLLKSGLATWDDIVTPSRVRDFREVVAKQRLTVDQMVKHGVKPLEAKRAYSAVHTAEHEHIERQRQELLQKITGAGLSQENLVRELSKGLAARVTVAAGPTGAQVGRPQDGTAPAWGGGPLPVAARATAAELAAMISGWKQTRPETFVKPPTTWVSVEQEQDKITLTFGGRTFVVVSGTTALGRTYDEWLKIAKERR